MVELIVGLFIAAFVYFGFRDGLAKTLGSIVVIFIALFLSSAVISILAGIASEFSNPKSLVTMVVFFIVWLVLYTALHLLIKLILKVVVQITILGSLDQIGGLFLGAVKGLLLAGIFLQLILSFPVSSNARQTILKAIPAKFSIATFQWLYPAAQKMYPYLDHLIKIDNKNDVMESISLKQTLTTEAEGMIKQNLPSLEKATREQNKRLQELLEESEPSPAKPSEQK
jgi:uncharacterized membrane protein required for colicin V production